MFKVALTGNVASGKSSVARIWAEAGVPVVIADELAREAVAPGTVGLSRVVQAFGGEVLLGDGSLDRSELRDRVFRSPEKRALLEGILHPLIGSLRDDWVARMKEKGAGFVVAEVPLLYEVGLEEGYDAVVLVTATAETRARRLTRERGLDAEEAARIMAAQIPSEEKVPRADFVLENEGSKEDLKIRALALLDLMRARAKRRKSP